MRVRSLTRSLAVLVMVGAMALLVVACDETDAPSLDDPDATGRALVQEYGDLIVAQDIEGLRAFISDALMLIRADGSTATSDDYLSNLPTVRSFEIQEVSARQDGGTLVVQWSIAVDQDIEGETIVASGARRLSTFAWDPDAERWRLAAHANFDALATPVGR
jgi:hypothetical protein